MQNIDIYYIGYNTVKDSYYVKINNINPLYLIISEANGDKYLVYDLANEINEILKKYNELSDGIKN